MSHAVAKSVAEVHKLGSVHNDVISSNLIVTYEHISATKNEYLRGEAQGDLYKGIWNTMVEKDKEEETTDAALDGANMKIFYIMGAPHDEKGNNTRLAMKGLHSIYQGDYIPMKVWNKS
eukprot:6989200-Ditylum_brightwellii.AAC.1